MLFHELNRAKCKTYLLADEPSHQAVLIDPVKERVDRYIAILGYHGCRLEFVIDTHTHADHRSGVWDLRDLTGARVVMHRQAPEPHVDVHVEDGQELTLGEARLRFLYTPGHTPDGVSICVADRVFTGDTLLIHGTGRADFAGGDAGAQYDAIIDKLFVLPDETLVFPAHDYRGHTHSTIGEEKRANPRLAGRSRADYVTLMNNLGLPLPDKVQEALQANQCAIDDESMQFPSLAQLSQVRQVSVQELQSRRRGEAAPLLLDVREPDEFWGDLGHIAGSKLIPLHQLSERAAELGDDKERDIVVICRAGVRSGTAAALLTGLGFDNVSNLKGGILEWNDAGFPVEH